MLRHFLLLACIACCTISLSAQGSEYTAKPVPHFLQLTEAQPADAVPDLLSAYAKTSPETRFRESGTRTDDLGMTHVTYQQTYAGIPVDGYTYTAHLVDGQVATVTGAFAKTGDNLITTPAVRAQAGLTGALQQLQLQQPLWESADAPHDYTKPQGDLVIYYDIEADQAELAYKYDIYTAEPLYRAYVYVSALDGRVLFEDLRIHHVNTPLQAVSDYNGTVAITGDVSGSTYRLRQTAMGSGVETYSLNNGTSYGAASDVTDNTANPFNSDGTAVQAHYGAEQTYDYFDTKHGRNSYNGTGGKLLSYVHYSSNYVNAFWDGSRMTYGDGDGVNYGPLTSLDIAGHEMTHGVVEYSANLVYQRESGALNESFADIFGEMVEFHATGTNNWQMGTDIGFGGQSGAIRSMNNPNAYGDPDTYGGTNWRNPNCGTPTRNNDYCGVHSNSGVQNKCFYILAVGESGTNDIGSSYSVSGIGRTKAGAIAYRNLTTYLSANSTFADARAGAIQSAKDLYGAGSDEEIQTTNAWYAVGVGAAYSTGGGGGGGSCVDVSVDMTLLTDNYGSETSWNVKNAAGQTVESGSGYANNTTYNFSWTLPAGNYTFTINDSYGDGICCSYGQGNYTITSNGTTVVSGGAFASSETTSFCTDGSTGPGPDTEAPTVPGNVSASNIAETTLDLSWSASTDNVGVVEYTVYLNGSSIGTTAGTSASISGLTAGTSYTFGVSASDAAGNESGQGTTTATTTGGGGGGGGGGTAVLLASYFESGLDGWLDGGSDCYRYTGSRSYEGSRSMRLRDNSGVASSMTTAQGYDLTGASSVDIEFYFYPNSMENGEDFWVQYNSGSGWQTVASYASGTNFNNGTFYTATVTLSPSQYNFTSNGKFRFRCDASANADQVYIDQVTITRIGGGAFMAGQEVVSSQTCTPLHTPAFTGVDLADPDGDVELTTSIAPNPTRSDLDLQLSDASLVERVTLMSSTGQVLRVITPEEYTDRIDVSRTAPGLYLLVIQDTEGEVRTLRFVKQ